ncbi:hypothetical protein [Spirosoma fluviale]|uniref:Uncharacterized protein n=1 Tax=Spirosoma fluviale TaxID=1597977 RepID=A0A286GX11_9BACT|nr:hypothetical protein [Spirosoma fluviale]SOD99706.1 hypothetical protein SAMN06269250_0121 [Spirosoma fluviale]
MPQATWEQETDPRKLKLIFPTLGQSFYLTQTEAINQLASSANQIVQVHKNEYSFEVDFRGLKAVPQKPGIPREGSRRPVPSGDVIGIEQNGAWLGMDGWQSDKQYFKLRPADEGPVIQNSGGNIAPPKAIKYKLCKNTLANGATCNTPNIPEAIVCRSCGSEKYLEPVYE